MSSVEKKQKGLTRRDFVKGATAGAVGGLVVATAGTALSATKIPPKPWLPAKWDYEADIVILGTGLAGLSTAITAHDAGAKVLILEKMSESYEGGNSKVSSQTWCASTDATLGAEYYKSITLERNEDEEIFTIISKGFIENLSVIEKLGGKYAVSGKDGEWPMYPGADTIRKYNMVVDGTIAVGGGYLWQLYKDNVTKRGIKILFETPAKELIQDCNTRHILGVKAESKGAKVMVKARKAVVLACGGFEFDENMRKEYLPAWPIYGWGTPGNTGDGIKMALKVGADLWHMNQPNGGAPNAMIFPEFSMTVGTQSGPTPRGGYIWVDKHGSRYMNEKTASRHSWGLREHTLKFDGVEADFTRIPIWLIFDEPSRLRGPLVSAGLPSTWFTWYSGYTWSKDNSAEIAKGWITKAASIEELAAAIAADPDNRHPNGKPTMDAKGTTLQATLTKYNGYCAAKRDEEFGRPADTLIPVNTPPFYAVKVWPGAPNTLGGPKRNKNCQILDLNGNVIPRLYGTGELGSFFGWMYQGGGDLAECMLTGRIAGKNGVAEAPWK